MTNGCASGAPVRLPHTLCVCNTQPLAAHAGSLAQDSPAVHEVGLSVGVQRELHVDGAQQQLHDSVQPVLPQRFFLRGKSSSGSRWEGEDEGVNEKVCTTTWFKLRYEGVGCRGAE